MQSGITALDTFLGGGLAKGALTEWGLPHGQMGRMLILRFLAKNKPLCLWIYHAELTQFSDDTEVYPPAWQCLGVDLSCTYFVRIKDTLLELKPLFIDPLFRCLIIDSPQKLAKQDLAFIAYNARRNAQTILLLRPYLLKSAYPTPLAKMRINCEYQESPSGLKLSLLRGGPNQSLFLPKASFIQNYLLSEEDHVSFEI